MAALLPPVSASRYGDNGMASSLGSISVSIVSRSNLGAKLHFMPISSRLGSIQYYGPWTSFCKLCSHKERNVVDSILELYGTGSGNLPKCCSYQMLFSISRYFGNILYSLKIWLIVLVQKSSWCLKATKGPSDSILSETVGDIADGCASNLQVDKSDSGDQANTLILDSFVQTITNDSPVRKETLPSVQNILSPSDSTPSLCITVLGATGDLARKKIFPALFALFYNGCLPKNIGIFGYSRSSLSDEDLRNLISENLTCRVDHHENCMDRMEGFLDRVFYVQGTYDTCEGMLNLDKRMRQLEGGRIANRIFYLSVPNDVVVEVATCVAKNAQSKKGYTRVIIEKPFGVDDESSARMTNGLLSELREEQIFRIDHLLGKELIENLTVLRFSNLIFEPLWNRNYIRNVQIVYAEDWGMQGRGRYFDEQGVIRDIVQSHLLQTIALLAMEPPVSLGDEDIRNEKVKVLRSMRKLALQDVVLGQYKESVSKDGKSIIPGYIDEEDVPPGSLTPTFVAAVFFIDNGRWDGVPFLIKAGHGLIKHKVEIRIQFRHVPGNLYKERERYGFNINQATNELVLRIHPDEAILLKIMNKVPGLELQLDFSELNLLYKDKYNSDVPDSYERLILDVIDGDNHLFIRSDELTATWDILTPLLKDIETLKVPPELYMFGGRGPVGAYYLGAKHGVRWADD